MAANRPNQLIDQRIQEITDEFQRMQASMLDYSPLAEGRWTARVAEVADHGVSTCPARVLLAHTGCPPMILDFAVDRLEERSRS